MIKDALSGYATAKRPKPDDCSVSGCMSALGPDPGEAADRGLGERTLSQTPMSDAGDAQNHRDFPGRVLLINLLRALHLVGVVGLGAAALGVRPVAETTTFAGILMASGIFIAVLDRCSNPAYFSQMNGLVVLLKVLLLAGFWMLADFSAVLFWALLAGSVLMAHAPRWIRHRKIF